MTAGRGLDTRFEAAEESTGLLLWQVTNRWQAAQRAALQPFGLTHVQFVLVASLAWLGAEGPVTQRQLADHAGTDPMMTSQVVRTLVDKGLRRAVAPPRGRPGVVALGDRRRTRPGEPGRRGRGGVRRVFFAPAGPGRDRAFTRSLAALEGRA